MVRKKEPRNQYNTILYYTILKSKQVCHSRAQCRAAGCSGLPSPEPSDTPRSVKWSQNGPKMVPVIKIPALETRPFRKRPHIREMQELRFEAEASKVRRWNLFRERHAVLTKQCFADRGILSSNSPCELPPVSRVCCHGVLVLLALLQIYSVFTKPANTKDAQQNEKNALKPRIPQNRVQTEDPTAMLFRLKVEQ